MARARKLVVVSNRGPYRREGGRWIRSAGGLVAALHPMLVGRGGVWVSAKQAKDFDTVQGGPEVEYELASVRISPKLQRAFYLDISNAIIWPLLHSFPTTMAVADAPWDRYVKANELFADVTFEASKPRDLVWIHDYHLMLVPGMLRERRKRARIGWFCHVPWPPAQLFGILPWRADVLEGLLGADVLGFHTQQYVDHFLDCVDQYTDHHVDRSRGTVKLGRRIVRCLAAPIGIPVQQLQELAAHEDVVAELARIRKKVDGRRVILGVDRLDYTKGIPERMRAFDRFLSKNADAREEVVMVQIMVPSRTDVQAYKDLKDEIDRLVGDINGRHASTGRIPLQYFFRGFDQKALFAHYRAADVALVTPLRDGMNLVAHEYVASRIDLDGVIVLSEFAGAAGFMHEAVQVNPYDVDAIASAIGEALSMPKAEQKKRMKALRSEVLELDVHRWADDFLSALEHG
ncbi:MAG: trehalose-6-phosphate synthase [Myxococcales bacterium]|nr:trehalose-6-phosphate synthase [Myxococcales bacterium]